MQHDPVTPKIAVRPYPVTAVVPSEHRGWLRYYRSLSYFPNSELYRQKVHECVSFLGILKYVFIFPIMLYVKYREVINPLEHWNSSNTWKQPS